GTAAAPSTGVAQAPAKAPAADSANAPAAGLPLLGSLLGGGN
ncbi:MAG: hypothetical protein JWR81_1818, partial [Pseudonocardia sp.]|nr:hypothetical protein [Pseudonocardia sp.]